MTNTMDPQTADPLDQEPEVLGASDVLDDPDAEDHLEDEDDFEDEEDLEDEDFEDPDAS
jgi:hypothetical protein